VAPYVWWFLIVGLAVGGVIVAALSMDTSRRDEDIEADETEAEAGLIASQLGDEGRPIDRDTVLEVLQAHREYRRVPPPDRLVAVAPDGSFSAPDADADDEADEVRDGRSRRADEDLPPA
jgi:hypothetical protein